MNDQKLSHYTQGLVRKSKREKEKEAAEAKRREEEENTAKAYTEFLDAFQGEDADRRKAGSAFVRAGQGSTYEPSVKKEPVKSSSVFEDDAAVSWLQSRSRNSATEHHHSPLHRHRFRDPRANGRWTPSWRKSRGAPRPFYHVSVEAD